MNDRFTLKIGGAVKIDRQIKEISQVFIAVDGIEHDNQTKHIFTYLVFYTDN